MTPGSAESVFDWARQCDGILIFHAPTVATAMAAANGAAANRGIGAPRIYLVDSRRAHLLHLFRELAKEDLAGEATLYHGSLRDFLRDVPVGAGQVWVDGGMAGEPTGMERGHSGFVPSIQWRMILQGRLHERYFQAEGSEESARTSVSDLTAELRREAAAGSRAVSGYGPWPYVAPDSTELPGTMPSGKAWPRISIVTPTFNQGSYIEETLLSVLNQGYPNVEHIVVDGGSTDGTPAILERYRDRLAYVIGEPDNGQSHAINKGMAVATGEILTWLNSDDMLAPGALASVALAFDTHEADMIAGICRLYREGQLVEQHITSCAEGPLPLEDLLDLDHGWNAGQFFYQPEVMFTRELWQRAGGYVNDWLHYSMDYELWLRFAQAGARLHAIGRPVAWFRLHDGQKRHSSAQRQAELRVCRRGFLKQNDRADVPAPDPGELRQRLRITLLNDIGPFYGAGIAHVRMARTLAWAGHEVALVSILDRSLLGIESTHYTTQDVVDRVLATHPDLVIVGNLHAAGADSFLIQLLCEQVPTAVVMHDFWTVTGRCAYPGPCEKYLTGCDHTCPTPNEYPALPPDEIAEAWSKKRLILGEAAGPALLTNSQWAAGIAAKAFAAGIRTPTIAPFHLSFPLEIFRPRDKRMCREMFGLPNDRFIILLPGAIGDSRKGGMAFIEALAQLELPDLLVVTLGRTDPSRKFPVEVRQLGQINGQHRVAMVNSAADLVVSPSTEETFGQTFIEAIACGTPALGYPAAGMREAICDGVTGLLAADTDPASLAAAVQHLYAHPEARQDLSRWGRLYVENEWSELAASRWLYLALRAIDGGRLKVARNLRFLAAEPAIPPFQVVARCRDGWRPSQGFSQMEHAQPEYGLKPYRWAYGPSAIAELLAEDGGLHRVLIAYRNPHDGQRMTLSCNGTECGAFDLPNTGFGAGRMLVANVPLEKGGNFLRISFSQWDRHREDLRPLAIVVTDIVVEPVAMSDHLARQTSAEQMLATVWSSETK